MEVFPTLYAFFLGFALTLILTPIVRDMARRSGALDQPDPRKVHKVPTPLWGGLAVSTAFFIALLTVLLTCGLKPLITPPLIGLLVGGAAIVLVGMWDDRHGMPAKVKLLAQIGIAMIIIGSGVRIDYLSLPFMGFVYLQEWQAVAVALLWLVGITNAINLLDGLDGLVAGVTFTTAVVFLVVASLNNQWLAVIAMAALAGCALGFLKYNFNPAQIFMGDTGSLFVGLMFAGWALLGFLKTTATVALAIPVVVIMGVPILDTAFAIVRRSLSRQPIFKPDKGHLHHRLLGLGLSQRQAVVCIYVINAMFGLAGLALACAVN